MINQVKIQNVLKPNQYYHLQVIQVQMIYKKSSNIHHHLYHQLPVSYLPDGHIPKLTFRRQNMPSPDLNPATPSVILETRREATSTQLQQYCLSQSICIVRGLANVLKLDLGLFSTKTLS